MEMAFMTINQVDIINLEDFIQQILEESILVFICYIILIEGYSLKVHLFQMA